MIKYFGFFILLLSATPGFAQGHEGQPHRLVLLNWGDYIEPSLLRDFEALHGVQVTERYFSSDADRSALLEAEGSAGFDVILVAGTDIRLYVQQGWIAPLQEDLIPSLKQVDPEWRNAFSGSLRYALPYMWGTTGIAYRSDLVAEAPTSWLDLLQPGPELQGAIQMTDDISELMQAALKALGYSLNSGDEAELEQARQLLLAQRPHVAGYRYSADLDTSPLLDGTVRAAYCYNGDALMLQSMQPAIQFVVPEEGSNLWGDYLAVSSQAREPLLAHLFLDFINQAEHAARNARYLYSATPNLNAQALLPEEMRQDPLVFPSAEILHRSEVGRMISTDLLQRRRAFSHVLLGPAGE